MGKNIIIFVADMSLSVYIDNKNRNILILGEGLTQGFDDTTLTAEAIYPINFTQSNKRFVLSLHYNWSNSLLFVNAAKQINSKQKKQYPVLTSVNISKDFTFDNMRKTGLKWILNFFSVNFDPIDTNDILDIHKYLKAVSTTLSPYQCLSSSHYHFM